MPLTLTLPVVATGVLGSRIKRRARAGGARWQQQVLLRAPLALHCHRILKWQFSQKLPAPPLPPAGARARGVHAWRLRTAAANHVRVS